MKTIEIRGQRYTSDQLLYLDCETLAKIFGVTPETIRRWTRDGEIKVTIAHHGRIGYRYFIGDVYDFMLKKKTHPKRRGRPTNWERYFDTVKRIVLMLVRDIDGIAKDDRMLIIRTVNNAHDIYDRNGGGILDES